MSVEPESPIPEPVDGEDDDVAWALQTAQVQWKRGSPADALVWLKRAVDAAIGAGNAWRASQLSASAAAMEERFLSHVGDAALGAEPEGEDVDVLLSVPPPPPPGMAVSGAVPQPLAAVVVPATPAQPPQRAGRPAPPPLPRAVPPPLPRDAPPVAVTAPDDAAAAVALATSLDVASSPPSHGPVSVDSEIADAPPENPFITGPPPEVRPKADSLSDVVLPERVPERLPFEAEEESAPVASSVALDAARVSASSAPPASPAPPRTAASNVPKPAASNVPKPAASNVPKPAASSAPAAPRPAAPSAARAKAPPPPSAMAKEAAQRDVPAALVPPPSRAPQPSAPADATVKATPSKAPPPFAPDDEPFVRKSVPRIVPEQAPASSELSLLDVPGLQDLPEESQSALVAAATRKSLAASEEASSFAVLLVMSGSVSILPAIADLACARAAAGDVVFTRGTLADGVALRVTASDGGAEVATWDQGALDAATSDCPWVADELSVVADRFQALAGATMGVLGDRLDDVMFQEVTARCELRRLEAGERLLAAGAPVAGLTVVGAGRLVLRSADAEVVDELGPGDIVYAPQVMTHGKAEHEVIAGASGALVLSADRKIAHELMLSVPPLLEILAG